MSPTPPEPPGDDPGFGFSRAIKRLRVAALLLGLTIALSLPVARLFFGSDALRDGLQLEIDQLADHLSTKASIDPRGWALERDANALELERVVRHDTVVAARLVDTQGKVLAHAGEWEAKRQVVL